MTAIQAEIKRGTTHTMVWIPFALRAGEGDPIKDGKGEVWYIVKKYPMMKQTMPEAREWSSV